MALRKVHFQLITPYLNLEVRDFELDFTGNHMPGSVLPTDYLEDDDATATHPILDGEFLTLTDAGKAVRPADGVVTLPSFPVYAERGRSELMAINKVPLIYMGSFEAETWAVQNDTDDWSAASFGDRLVVNSATTIGPDTGTPMVTGSFFSVPHLLPYQDDDTSLDDAADQGNTIGHVVRPWGGSASGGVRIYCSLGLNL